MVDLNELQKEIDALIDNETDDSLLNWYMAKQFPSYKSLLGDGDFVDFKINAISIRVEPTKISLIIKEDAFINNTKFAMAA